LPWPRGRFSFFKQKTAYEIFTCWSSDVCSSDLHRGNDQIDVLLLRQPLFQFRHRNDPDNVQIGHFVFQPCGQIAGRAKAAGANHHRSEERRVGKECRSGWAAYDCKEEKWTGALEPTADSGSVYAQ